MRQRRTDTHTHIHIHRQMFLSPTYSSCWHLLRSSLSLSCSLHSTTLHSLMSRDSQSDEETTNSQSETLLNVKLQEMAAKNGDDVVPTVVNWMAANSAGLSLSLCLSLSATLSSLLPQCTHTRPEGDVHYNGTAIFLVPVFFLPRLACLRLSNSQPPSQVPGSGGSGERGKRRQTKKKAVGRAF